MWREMLGLSPLPPRTPLAATVTGVLERGDYVVEKIHFQSLPGAYVIGNLYRPAKPAGRLPAVLYLCGHTKGKVNPPYQANPRWFGQHGYVALVLDPIQLGESQGFHHGTYREERWDWPSRGYTPAGTEVWNAMRALDYLETRPDVDADRMGVTGLSGGGVISWCLGAADERVKVVVPVCQSGSIEHVVFDRATDGHCDCAFWINYYRWCWPDIGALIAPRSLLIASGSEDVLWRPYGYRDVAHRIRRQYAALGAGSHFDLVEDLTPHGYTPKLRRAIFTWFNTHLKNDPTPVTDDVTDFVEPEENLLVFGGKLPDRTMKCAALTSCWCGGRTCPRSPMRPRGARTRRPRSSDCGRSRFATRRRAAFRANGISERTAATAAAHRHVRVRQLRRDDHRHQDEAIARSAVAHPHAGLRGATGRAQHLRGRRFFAARQSPASSRPRPSRCATRPRRRSAPAICGRRGEPIRSWARRSPSVRSAICSPPSRCCGRSR